MKQLTKDPNAASKAERERKANEEAGLKSINLSISGAGGGGPTKKKPVFKSTLQPHNAAAVGQAAPLRIQSNKDDVVMTGTGIDDEQWLKDCMKLAAEPVQQDHPDRYDPRYPSQLGLCPFPGCDDGNCRHANGPPARDPRSKTLEQLLRARGLPARGASESWDDFRHRRMVQNVDELQSKCEKVHGNILSYMQQQGLPVKG